MTRTTTSASLRDLAGALRDGSVSAAELADAAIAAHEANDESFGAYKLWDPERTRKQAQAADAAFAAGIDLGPLQGIPMSVKDLYGVTGWPTYAGTPKQLPSTWEHEGPVITALQQQAAVITGKTHTVEFAFGGIGLNPHWDTPRNPWDADRARAPGGSSSGAGVSLAAGSACLALGTDTAGSVRIPASMTGNVGLKTSHGRWSIDQIAPLSPSLDTAGVLGRSVEDVVAAFVAIDPSYAGARHAIDAIQPAPIEGLRLGVSDTLLWDDCSPGVAEGVKAALAELVSAGAREVRLPFPEALEVNPIFLKGGLAAAELYTFVQDEIPEWFDLIDPIIRQRMAEAKDLPAHEYIRRIRTMERLADSADARLSEVDVLVSPTVAITPPALDDIAEIDAYRPANLLALRNTAVANYLSLCALTLPVALDRAGMPVGLQLMARYGEEEKLLATGLAVEQALGTGRDRFGTAPMSQSI